MLAHVLAGLLLLVACGGDKRDDGGAAGSNAPVTSSPDDDVIERAIRSIATISDLATRHGKNCDALAQDLAAHAQRDAPVIASFKTLMSDPTKQQALATRYGERIQQVGQAAVKALRDHCASHPAVANVFKQLE